MSLGDRLQQLRAQEGLSRGDVATLVSRRAKRGAGVKEDTVGGWERGDREPDGEIQEFLADYFGVTVEYLRDRIRALRDSPATVEAKVRILTDLSSLPVQATLQDRLNTAVQSIIQHRLAWDMARIARRVGLGGDDDGVTAILRGTQRPGGAFIEAVAELTGAPSRWFLGAMDGSALIPRYRSSILQELGLPE